MTSVKISAGSWQFTWDRYLLDNMTLVLTKAIPNKWDCVGIVYGKEGTGKSTLATQLAVFMDDKFNLDQVAFTPQHFLKIVDSCREESSILWDEAITGATAQQQGNEISQAIISRLTTIRRKRLKIFICFPYLHMLNKYFVSRCLFSIYVYAKSFDDRGFMRYYNQKKTEVLFELMKNKYTYNPLAAIRRIKPSFFCKYPSKFCLPEKEYEERKERSTQSNPHESKREVMWKGRVAKLIKHLSTNRLMTQRDVGEVLGIDERTISKLMGEYKSNEGILDEDI